MCGEVYKKPLDESRNFLLITSAIGLILGTIIGVSARNVFAGMWFGIGGGVALSYISFLPVLFRGFCRDEGFIEGMKSTLGGGVVWFFIFMLIGPIGFIIRLLRTW